MLPRILSTTIGRHRLERPRSAVFRVGRADCHLLPRILSTNSGTIDWSSRILRLRTPPSASRPPPLSGGLSGSAGEPAIHASFLGNRFAPIGSVHPTPRSENHTALTRSTQPAIHSGNYTAPMHFVMWIIVFSGWGLGRRLFQKCGLPSVSLVSPLTC